MKKRATLCRRGMAGTLAAVMLAATLTGCGQAAESLMSLVTDYMPGVQPGQTVSEDSKWVNSSIVGSLEKDTPTSEKDDFYTAANRDWFLETDLPADELNIGPFSDSSDNLDDRLASILLGTPDEKADLTNKLPGLSNAQVDHDLELIRQLAALAEDDAAREAAGVEPARPYIEAVQNITTMDEMTAFLCNENGRNIALNYLVPFDVAVPYTERTAYVVTVEDTPAFTLSSDYDYRSLNIEAQLYKALAFKKASYLFERLGWSAEKINDTFYRCLNLEQKLAHNLYDTSMLSESDYAKLFEMKDNNFTKAELTEIQGNYPLVQTLESCGMADTDRYIVCQPDYVRAVGRLYTQENLEDIKAYFLVHSVDTLLPLLDEESCEIAAENGSGKFSLGATPETAETSETPASETTEEKDPAVTQAMDTISNYIGLYLSDPLQQIYVARYCTVEQKARMQTMIDKIMDAYHTMLKSEAWMGEETCAKAIEKLDKMAVRNLYPDEFIDYSALDISEADDLVDAVATIRRFDRLKQNALIGQPIGSNYWDMARMPTITVNAMYMPQENSINLLAGLFSSDFFYSDSMSDEMLLARTGTIIGHEISHAFDSTGCEFDAAGYKTSWWTTEDYDRYKVRTGHLIKDYGTQFLAPNISAASYGDVVNGEAVADMAGVKVSLLVAKEKPGFDYDAFFTAYAQLWREKFEFKSVMLMMNDVHPMAFLRCNKTLQQFDEFMTTYGVGPNDGMYLAPENRITVW